MFFRDDRLKKSRRGKRKVPASQAQGCRHGERTTLVMASAARPSILEVRGDGLPRFARSDGIFFSQ
jgi:hypothetical protein